MEGGLLKLLPTHPAPTSYFLSVCGRRGEEKGRNAPKHLLPSQKEKCRRICLHFPHIKLFLQRFYTNKIQKGCYKRSHDKQPFVHKISIFFYSSETSQVERFPARDTGSKKKSFTFFCRLIRSLSVLRVCNNGKKKKTKTPEKLQFEINPLKEKRGRRRIETRRHRLFFARTKKGRRFFCPLPSPSILSSYVLLQEFGTWMGSLDNAVPNIGWVSNIFGLTWKRMRKMKW